MYNTLVVNGNNYLKTFVVHQIMTWREMIKTLEEKEKLCPGIMDTDVTFIDGNDEVFAASIFFANPEFVDTLDEHHPYISNHEVEE